MQSPTPASSSVSAQPQRPKRDSSPRVPSDYIAIKRTLGQGSNATVYLVEYNTERTPCAMKKIPRNNKRTENMNRLRANNPARAPLPRTSDPTSLVDRRGTEEAKIRKEIAIMKKCDHPNIIKFYSFIDDKMSANICLIMEYMEGGELQWTSDNEPYLTMDQARRCMRDVVLGLQYRMCSFFDCTLFFALPISTDWPFSWPLVFPFCFLVSMERGTFPLSVRVLCPFPPTGLFPPATLSFLFFAAFIFFTSWCRWRATFALLPRLRLPPIPTDHCIPSLFNIFIYMPFFLFLVPMARDCPFFPHLFSLLVSAPLSFWCGGAPYFPSRRPADFMIISFPPTGPFPSPLVFPVCFFLVSMARDTFPSTSRLLPLPISTDRSFPSPLLFPFFILFYLSSWRRWHAALSLLPRLRSLPISPRLLPARFSFFVYSLFFRDTCPARLIWCPRPLPISTRPFSSPPVFPFC